MKINWIRASSPPPVHEAEAECGMESGPVIGLVSGVVCPVFYIEHFGPAWFTRDGEDVTRKITHWTPLPAELEMKWDVEVVEQDDGEIRIRDLETGLVIFL